MNDIKFINLNNNVDLNDITNRGIYEIKGYANQNTSLPIGHLTEEYVNGLLIVLDNSNTSKNVSITQFLILSSTLKNIYIRKGVGDINNIIWDSWIKELNNGTIDDLTNISDRINNNVENIDELFKRLQGISEYTNPLTDPFEFLGEFANISVLINFLDNFKQNKGEFRALVNNNIIIISSNNFSSITAQTIKGCIILNEDNTIKLSTSYNEYRRFYLTKWMDWDIINKQDIVKLINSEVEKLLEGTDPEKIDSIKDLINWVDEHGKDAAELAKAIQTNTTAIQNEKDRAVSVETILNNSIATLNTTIINYNQRYSINKPVTKKEVIENLLNKYTADKGTIVTYYAEDGWHTIQYKLNYYRPEQAKDESNWVEIINEDAIKDIKDSIDNAYVKPEGGIPNIDLSKEVQEAINNAGKVADDSVTENKLSPDVKNKLNTAYNKATLADSLITNFNKIKPKIGAVEDDGTIYYGTSFCSHIALTGEGKLLLNDGYFIDKVLFLLKDGSVIDIYGENLNITSLEFGDDTLSWLIEFRKSDNTTFNNNDLEKVIKNVSFNSVAWNEYSNLDNYNCIGEYIIRGERKNNDDNMPINNLGDIEARLNVISDTIGKNATQVLTLLNVGGGDGNIYTRTRQDNTWGAWGKLQTNVEVGVINQQQMDALIDNGIYSGVLSTTGETFVLVVINNYAIAQQAGYGGYISHLKYSVGLDGVVKVETRRRDAYGFWTEWQGIGGGGGYTLPVATDTTLGGVKSYAKRGYIGDSPAGREYALNVNNDGSAFVTIPVVEEVDANNHEPVSSSAVVDYVAEVIDTPIVNQTATTATIAPNVLNVWGEVSSLDITLSEPKDGVINEYMFQFTSGATATTLALPDGIKWVSVPNIQANKTYQVSIINNLGVIGEFSHE